MRIFHQQVLLQSHHHLRLARRNTGQPATGQFTADLPQQRRRHQGCVHQRFRQGHVTALLGEQHKIQFAHTQAAELFRHGNARQPEFCKLLPEARIAATCRVPAGANPLGRHLSRQKVAHR